MSTHIQKLVYASQRSMVSKSTIDEVCLCVCAGCIHICLDLCPEAMLLHLISIETSLQGQKCPSKAKGIIFFKSGDRYRMIIRNRNYPSINNTEIEVMRRNDGGKRLS